MLKQLSTGIGALVLMVVWTACSTGTDRSVLEEQLMDADRSFASDTAKKGLAGWLSWFDESAAVFPRDRETVRGLDRIRAFYEETGFDPSGLRWEPERAMVSEDGTLGMTEGTWTLMELTGDGETEVASGKYMSVWRKGEADRWRVVADIGTTDVKPDPVMDGSPDS